MKTAKNTLALTAAISASMIGSVAGAAEVLVTADITTSTTWTSNNVYNLQGARYVTNGATLTSLSPGMPACPASALLRIRSSSLPRSTI